MREEKTRRFSTIFVGVLFLLTMVPLVSYAEVPQMINFQGKLVEDGTPLTGYRSMTFSFWDSDTGGDPAIAIWFETQVSVEITDGIYDVQLGSVTDLPSDLSDYDALYLQVDVVHPTEGSQRLEPLLELTSTVFAIKAGDAENLDGRDSTYFAPADHDHDGEYVNEGQANAVTSDMIADAAITSADLGADSVASNEIAAGAVASSEILDDSITAADLAAESIGSSEIAAGAVGSSEIANGSVTADDMQNGAALAEISDDDGTGSDLDADFLDGKDSTAFMDATTDNWVDITGDTMTGMLNLDVDSGGTLARGIYVDADHTGSSGYCYGAEVHSDSTNGSAYGIRAYSTSANSGAYGLRATTRVESGSTSNVYGLYNDARHNGSTGTAYGMYSLLYGSNEGDAYGIYSQAKKYSSDTAGTAYGGHFIGDNDRTGGTSYGLYAEATGANGPRYGLYSLVDTSGASAHTNYGVYSEASTSNGNLYGFYGDIDSSSVGTAYGEKLYVDKSSTATGNLYGVYSDVNHAGASGYVYGVRSHAYSSDTGSTYGGFFSGGSSSGDTGDLYGVRAYCDNNTSGNEYAGYFYKFGGGDYAGYFSGNVHVSGTLTATSKPFVQPHKSDPSKEIVYVSLEGPEHAIFTRGTATLENGVAVIEMPEHWEEVAAEEGITVNLTPEGMWAPLYVESKSKSEVVVRVASGGPEDASFSYCILARRDGFQEHEPIQENTHFTSDGVSAWEFENRYTEETLDNRAIRAMLRSNGIMDAEGKLNADTATTLNWKVTPNEEDSHYLEVHGLAMHEDRPEDLSPPPRPSHQEPEAQPEPLPEPLRKEQ